VEVYQEDFSDPRSGWPNRHDPLRNAHYRTHGGYELSRNFCPATAPVAASGEFVTQTDSVVAAYGPWWNNFRATATMKIAWGSRCPNGSKPAAGLLFHVMEQGFYGLLVGHAAGNGLSFELVRGMWGSPIFQLIPWTKLTSTPYDSGREYKLAVEYRRPTIKIDIDGRTVGTAQDTTFQYGLMGFGVFDKGRLDIGDLSVEALLALE